MANCLLAGLGSGVDILLVDALPGFASGRCSAGAHALQTGEVQVLLGCQSLLPAWPHRCCHEILWYTTDLRGLDQAHRYLDAAGVKHDSHATSQ